MLRVLNVCGSAFFVFAVWAVAPAHGGFLTSLKVEQTTQTSGLFHYEYTLVNQAESTLPAASFALDVAPMANIQSLNGPSGWDILYTAGDSVVLWLSQDAPSDIQPGDSGLFSFISPLDSVLQGYLVVGIDPSTFEIETAEGKIASPGVSSVPEPSTLMLCGIGLLGLLGYVGWPRDALRRRRRAPIASTRLVQLDKSGGHQRGHSDSSTLAGQSR